MTVVPVHTARTPLFESAQLDRLAVHRYQARFVARERVIAPPDRFPNMLRGVFEMAFRRLVCHDIALDCAVCPLKDACQYPAIFRPAPPLGADRLSKQQDLPRPFVFAPPTERAAELPAGSALDVALSVFGRANDALPYFVVALRSLADRGLGAARGRLRFVRLQCLAPQGHDETVFDESSPVVRVARVPHRLPDLRRPGDETARRIRIRFLGPTTLKRHGQLVERPSFADLACRLRDRLSTLAAFFGDGPLDIDFARLGAEAEAIRTSHCDTRWVHRTRRSARTGQIHETSGFVGAAVYEGELGPWMPLLRLGEVIHVGKYAVWGNGRLDVLADPGTAVHGLEG